MRGRLHRSISGARHDYPQILPREHEPTFRGQSCPEQPDRTGVAEAEKILRRAPMANLARTAPPNPVRGSQPVVRVSGMTVERAPLAPSRQQEFQRANSIWVAAEVSEPPVLHRCPLWSLGWMRKGPHHQRVLEEERWLYPASRIAPGELLRVSASHGPSCGTPARGRAPPGNPDHGAGLHKPFPAHGSRPKAVFESR